VKEVICLYAESGISARPWAENGYQVYEYDISIASERTVNFPGGGSIHYRYWNANSQEQTVALINRHKGKAVMVLGFPPCDDLAVCGAKHFALKAYRNPNFQNEAAQRAMTVMYVADWLGAVPYAAENPVSVLSTLWRKPDHIWNPWEFGGYLSEDDLHPDYPDYILPRDAYPKKTCYWTGNGFIFPPKKPVAVLPGYSVQFYMLGGKSAKTKRIRSASPRGMARAVYEANHKGANDES
jgi:hypothetical protein